MECAICGDALTGPVQFASCEHGALGDQTMCMGCLQDWLSTARRGRVSARDFSALRNQLAVDHFDCPFCRTPIVLSALDASALEIAMSGYVHPAVAAAPIDVDMGLLDDDAGWYRHLQSPRWHIRLRRWARRRFGGG